MSLTGPHSSILERAIQQACRQQVIIVSAVGNSGPLADTLYPAGYQCTVAVTAIDNEGVPFYRAGRGDHVDFASLGVNVAHALPGGYKESTGTSFATAYVTAFIANKPDLKNKADLKRLARDAGTPGKDPVYGYGILERLP